MHILLVEDEPELSRLAAVAMEDMGHQVTVVSGVEAALAQLQGKAAELDLMIADHRLPDGWGVALCVECRVKFPKLKVCVVSGCLNSENVELLEEFNIPYWRKPVLYSSVLRKMLRPQPSPVPAGRGSLEEESA